MAGDGWRVTSPESPPKAYKLETAGFGHNVTVVITLDKKRAAGAVLLELSAEQHRLREALGVLRRQHGADLELPWEKLAGQPAENAALYDAWIEHQGLTASLRAVESDIAGIRHGDFSFA